MLSPEIDPAIDPAINPPNPVISGEVAVTAIDTDPITGWQVAIKGAGKTTFLDGVEYGAESPAIQALIAQTATALVGLGGLGALGNVGDISLIRAESEAMADGLTIDTKLPGNLGLEARFFAEGKARVPKGSSIAKGFSVDRLYVGIHGESMDVELLAGFKPKEVIKKNGTVKSKPLSLQKLVNIVSTGNSEKIARTLESTGIFASNKTLLELGLGMNTTGFAELRTDILTSPTAVAAFPAGWDSTLGSLFA
jgi:hypothetical protein